MDRNSCLVYSNVNEVYQKLIQFCSVKRFKVKETHEEFYFIKARKPSLLFWRTQRLEMEILAVEKEQVQVTIKLYRGKRRPELENEYIDAIESFLNSTKNL